MKADNPAARRARPLRPERLCTPRKALFSVRPIGGGKFELLTLDSMVRAAKCKLICPRQWEAKHPLKLPAGI
jgi:hypothetical protein